MFLFSKKTKKKNFFSEFYSEILLIGWDVIFVYKNIIHWCISKFIITVWSTILWILVALPFFIISVIFGLLDPINWTSIIKYIVTGEDISLEVIGGFAQHPYIIAIMMFLVLVTCLAFVLASSYSLLLQANLALSYVNRKRISYKENLYFSRPHISTLMGLLTWNMVYLIAPFFIWFSAILGLYILHYLMGAIPLAMYSSLTLIVTLALIISMSYIAYKIAFAYTILATEKASKITSSRSYLHKSMNVASFRNFCKFLLLIGIYFILTFPIWAIGQQIDNSLVSMRDGYIYKAWFVDTIEPEERDYYDEIDERYKDVTPAQLGRKMSQMSMMSSVYAMLTYFAFGGLFIVLIASFYRRVLVKK